MGSAEECGNGRDETFDEDRIGNEAKEGQRKGGAADDRAKVERVRGTGSDEDDEEAWTEGGEAVLVIRAATRASAAACAACARGLRRGLEEGRLEEEAAAPGPEADADDDDDDEEEGMAKVLVAAGAAILQKLIRGRAR